MSAGLDRDLRAAFEAASEFVEPPGSLAERARRGARRRRRRTLAAAAAGCVALLVAAGLTYAVAGRHPGQAATHRSHAARIRLPFGYQVSELAAGGPYLYVLFDQVDVLAAYDRPTGALVRRVTLPDSPSSLTVGPGGLVWVAYDANSQGSAYGVWLLSPDLRLHTTLANVTLSAIVPVSRTTAWSPSQYGLYWLSLPAPGSAGHATWTLRPGTSLGQPLNTAPGPAVLAGGHVVAEVTDGYGYHGHLVIAGQPGVTYGGGSGTVVQGVAAQGGSIWAISGSDALNFGGALVRLDSNLRPTTPAAVRGNRTLSLIAAVWSHGDTIWVALGPPGWEGGHSLACFRAGAQIGRLVTLPVTGQVVALAAAGDSVYVSAAPAGQAGGGDGDGVTSFRVPAACR